ncbi:hypothetical protein ACFLZX_01945 [Nanoarchaeota archaeon]
MGLFLLVLAGCSECELSSDCGTPGKCEQLSCREGKCVNVTTISCCGNGVCEKDTGENKCICSSDCGKCEGIATMLVRDKERNAQFLKKTCIEDECIYAADPDVVKRTDLAVERELSFFTLDMLITFNNPFTIGKDTIETTFKLNNAEEELVYPVKITGVKFIEGQTLFGLKDGLEGRLNKIGDQYSVTIPVTFEPASIEEEKTISIKVDYEYDKKVKTDRNKDGTYNYKEEHVRDSFETRLTGRIFFLYPDGVKDA